MDYTQTVAYLGGQLREKIDNISCFADDTLMLGLFELQDKAVYNAIHTDLSTKNTKKAETTIREIIKRYVIGYREKGVIYYGVLQPIKRKIEYHTKNNNTELINKYMILYDDFMALASFRSFKHFCLYIETDFEKKIWQPTQDIFNGWYVYATQMVLDGKVQFIEKQLPTAYGKSFSDIMLICWIFGIDYNNEVIKIFGNKYNCSKCFDGISDIMTNPRYAKVFPYYRQFNCKPNAIYEICNRGEGQFKITGSGKPVNFLVVGKESKISGVRAKYLFLDDITQAEDIASIKQHDKDIYTYDNVWFKRSNSMNDFYIVASGTTYSIYDILSALKNKFGGNDAQLSNVNKYTRITKTDEIKKGGVAVFISVPKLDYDTDESTYPQEFPTAKARKQREDNYEIFMAMEQQMPLQPADNPFYYTNLLEYTTLPRIGVNGRTNECWAYLDGKRKGRDFCAMPIFTFFKDKWYLIDTIYDNRPMENIYASIVDKIIDHNVVRLCLESNINEGLKTLLDKMLASKGYSACGITENFSVAQKDIRISNCEATIKNSIVFPRLGVYARSSVIGRAMEELYGYSYVKKNDHDDFTDAVAGFVKAYIRKDTNTYAKIITFNR